ncbi:hypothetical protein PA598K_02826 [Paenibacillus sp. 598K]|uniref:NAD(P)/FAD-dependent oxidoreductase n=1 Tax=Paenibacillus sp. 598K TaxID=1117987 RepID=UPI000FF947D5|nr:FAD-dependent oxidoreductase [Paenibacillus sp. 598K]GBF74479.1 hypothetical protein PA598K_02826 [Paenibacillus sp. 598K]
MADVDVVVIGAGIAGSAAAIALARRGWRTALLDRQRFPRHKACGEFLSPESLAMLAELGLSGAVRASEPAEIREAALLLHGQRELRLPLPGTALGLSRYRLDQMLHDQATASGATLVTGVAASAVRRCDDGYIIEQSGAAAEPLHARAVIVATGSSARSGMPGAHSRAGGRQPRYIGIKTHLDSLAIGGTVELYFWEGGYLGLAPIEGGQVNAAALLRQDATMRGQGSILELLEQACRRHPALERRLRGAQPVPGTQAAVSPVPIGRRLLAWDETALIGDAASVIPPLCGDGMSMALRSALLCAEQADRYLAGRRDLDGWRHAYERELRRQLAGPRRWGRLLQWALGRPGLAPLLREAAVVAPRLARGLVQATRLRPWPVSRGLGE